MVFENGTNIERMYYPDDTGIFVGEDNVESMDITLDGRGSPWVKVTYDDGEVTVHNAAYLASIVLEDGQNKKSKECVVSNKFRDNTVKFSDLDVGTKFKWPLTEDATTYTKFCDGSGEAEGSHITVGLIKLDPFVYPIDESEECDGS